MVISHEVIGGVIGQELGNPYWAFLFGFLSHLLMDKIPHYFPKETKNKAIFTICEILMALGLMIFFLQNGFPLSDTSFWAGLAGGVMMDVLFVGVPTLKKSKIGLWHSTRQRHMSQPIYLVFDAIFVVGGLFILGFLK